VRRLGIIGAGLCVLLLATALAQALPSSLSTVMARLPEAERARLLQRHAQWQAMDEGRRTQWQQRRLAWDALPREEREQRRARYGAWRELDEPTRDRLRAASQAFTALPPQRQQELREQFAALDSLQRAGWRLGPVLGVDYDRLQPLFGFVAPEERAALLRLLQQSDAMQRDDLVALAQRLPPQERAAFRHALLQVPAARRGQWLRQQRAQ